MSLLFSTYVCSVDDRVLKEDSSHVASCSAICIIAKLFDYTFYKAYLVKISKEINIIPGLHACIALCCPQHPYGSFSLIHSLNSV